MATDHQDREGIPPDDFTRARELFRRTGGGMAGTRARTPANQPSHDAAVRFMERLGEAESEADAMMRLVASLPELPNDLRWELFHVWCVENRDHLVDICRQAHLDLRGLVFMMVSVLEPHDYFHGTA